MSSLPLSVRTALWVTAAWHGHGGLTDLDEAIAAAHPDLDHVEGDLGRVVVWRELGESALLVALPRPGDVSGMPRTAPDAAAAAAAAGECVFVAGVGGLLVPELAVFGSEGDEGTMARWSAHDAEPVARHVLESLDLSDLERSLARAVADGAESLESVEGRPWTPGPREDADRALGAAVWGLPGGLPPRAVRVMTTAARLGVIADEGLALSAAGPALDVHTSGHRELSLRRLAVAADHALAGATNVAVMSIAGWRPA
ncbi:hypothetical protein V3N99_01270 [Dermatophilaceae bacterium Soc4.6]